MTTTMTVKSRVDNVLLEIITLVSSAPIESDYYMYIHHCESAVSNNEHPLLKYKGLDPSSRT